MKNTQSGVLERTKGYLDSISRSCLKQKLTLSVAESVTSGYLQVLFSNAEKAQSFYHGGITVYNGAQKTRNLNIEPIYALESDCVSENISLEMARNVSQLFCSEIGIGITGFASLAPEDGINKLFAFVAVSKKNKLLFKAKIKPSLAEVQGMQVQEDYAIQVIKLLARKLKD
jgi:nicotinamide-nucleotide amidase